MHLLNEKVTLITGAARGIGQAIAVRYASAGAQLALCDLKEEWLNETAELVQKSGGEAGKYAMDVSNAESVQKGVDQIHKDFGQIDVLVNNAGITRDGLMMRMTEEDWDAVLNINLKGVFLCTKAATKYMMKKRSGAIVNISSVIGLMGNAGQCNYAASKGGVIALTKSVAKELAGRNIRANAIAPGFIESKMTEVLAGDVKQKMLEFIPAKNFGRPEDVAEVALFFASDMSRYITGQVLSVCGGMVMA